MCWASKVRLCPGPILTRPLMRLHEAVPKKGLSPKFGEQPPQTSDLEMGSDQNSGPVLDPGAALRRLLKGIPNFDHHGDRGQAATRCDTKKVIRVQPKGFPGSCLWMFLSFSQPANSHKDLRCVPRTVFSLTSPAKRDHAQRFPSASFFFFFGIPRRLGKETLGAFAALLAGPFSPFRPFSECNSEPHCTSQARCFLGRTKPSAGLKLIAPGNADRGASISLWDPGQRQLRRGNPVILINVNQLRDTDDFWGG